MNCTVCGNALIYDRAVFHCSCGVFIHSYCWNEHVLRAHQPPFEIGSMNLDGEFIPRESRKEPQVSAAPVPSEQVPAEKETSLPK